MFSKLTNLLKILLFLAFNLSINGQTSTLINTSSQSFGDGYFSGCQTFGTLNPVEKPTNLSTETDILPSGKTTIDVTHITTTQSKLELSKRMRSFSASFNGGLFKGNLAYNYSSTRSIKINNSSEYLLLELNVNSKERSLRNYKLTHMADSLLRNIRTNQDKINFINLYGDEFVSSVLTGCSLRILFEANSNDIAEDNSNNTLFNAGAKYKSADFHGSFNDIAHYMDSLSSKQINIYIDAIGVGGDDLRLPKFDSPSLSQYFQDFVQKNNNASGIIGVKTKSIMGLSPQLNSLFDQSLLLSWKKNLEKLLIAKTYCFNQLDIINSAIYKIKFMGGYTSSAFNFNHLSRDTKNEILKNGYVSNVNNCPEDVSTNITGSYDQQKVNLNNDKQFLMDFIDSIDILIAMIKSNYSKNYSSELKNFFIRNNLNKDYDIKCIGPFRRLEERENQITFIAEMQIPILKLSPTDLRKSSILRTLSSISIPNVSQLNEMNVEIKIRAEDYNDKGKEIDINDSFRVLNYDIFKMFGAGERSILYDLNNTSSPLPNNLKCCNLSLKIQPQNELYVYLNLTNLLGNYNINSQLYDGFPINKFKLVNGLYNFKIYCFFEFSTEKTFLKD